MCECVCESERERECVSGLSLSLFRESVRESGSSCHPCCGRSASAAPCDRQTHMFPSNNKLELVKYTPLHPVDCEIFMMSGLDGSGAADTVLTWEAFGGHVPPGGSEMYWFDQSYPMHLFEKIHASGTLESAPLDADASQ